MLREVSVPVLMVREGLDIASGSGVYGRISGGRRIDSHGQRDRARDVRKGKDVKSFGKVVVVNEGDDALAEKFW